MPYRRDQANSSRTPLYVNLLQALLLVTLAIAAHAQEPPKPPEATITGLVTDPSGAVVRNANITLHPTPESLRGSGAATAGPG
jgi:hypothetical protein